VGPEQASAPALAQRITALLPEVPAPKNPDGARHPTAEIRRCRRALSDHVAALHDIRLPWEVSAGQAQSALAALTARAPAPRSRLRIRPPHLDSLGPTELARLRAEVEAAARAGVLAHAPLADPWFGAQLRTTEEVNQAYELTRRLRHTDLPEVRSLAAAAMDEVGLPPTDSWAQLLERLELLTAIRGTLDVFSPLVFDAVLADQVAATATEGWRAEREISFSWWQRRRILAQVRRLLRPGPTPKSLHEALMCALSQREKWRALAGPGARPQLPRQLGEIERALQEATADLRWLIRRVPPPVELTHAEPALRVDATDPPAVNEPDVLGAPLMGLEDWLATLLDHDGAVPIIPQRVALQERLADVGLAGFLADVSTREVAAADVAAELDLVWWTSVLAHIGRSDPAYGRHDGEVLRAVQGDFAVADRQQQAVIADHVRYEVRQRLWHAARQFPDQVTALRAFAAGSTAQGLSPLLARAPQLLAAALPCWTMSPLSVAQTFAEGAVGEFDVVIIDEASQVRAAHVIPAIRRARQLVVVGDPRQLPPREVGAESILSLALPILPQFSLNRNYRSLAPELFSFANQNFYENGVSTWATAEQEPAVELITVDGRGVLSAGATAVESTEAEVSQVLDLVLEHARREPGRSLAVLTIGERHARRLAEAVRLTLAESAHLAARLQGGSQPISVKTVARAQGDEWDQVILALGFGKTPHGRLLHSFGPLGEPGGENLLNIALTRARRKLVIVSAFTAADVDLARISAPGARLLP
ncbi:MAG: DEAD/DEAH box helicase, partial [Angustibacter sp.]